MNRQQSLRTADRVRHCAAGLLLGILCLLQCGSLHAEALGTLRVTSQDFHQRVAAGVAWLEDKSGEATLEQIRAADARGDFAPYPHDSLQFGYSRSAYWIHFSLENQLTTRTGSSPLDRFFISVRYPLLDDVQFYAIRANGVDNMVLGDAHNYFERLFLLNDLIFPLALAQQEKIDIYLRVHSQLGVDSNLRQHRARLCTPPERYRMAQRHLFRHHTRPVLLQRFFVDWRAQERLRYLRIVHGHAPAVQRIDDGLHVPLVA